MGLVLPAMVLPVVVFIMEVTPVVGEGWCAIQMASSVLPLIISFCLLSIL
jgi:hypothetical protein